MSKLLMIFLISVSTVSFFSCNKCKNTVCENGTCNKDSGECECIDGWEGSSCNTKWSSKYFGDFTETADCATSPFSISVIETEGVLKGFTFVGFLGASGVEIDATINSPTEFIIPNQPYGVNTVGGEGYISEATRIINMEYYMLNPAGDTVGNCISVLNPTE